jgi:hypothetical protein
MKNNTPKVWNYLNTPVNRQERQNPDYFGKPLYPYGHEHFDALKYEQQSLVELINNYTSAYDKEGMLVLIETRLRKKKLTALNDFFQNIITIDENIIHKIENITFDKLSGISDKEFLDMDNGKPHHEAFNKINSIQNDCLKTALKNAYKKRIQKIPGYDIGCSFNDIAVSLQDFFIPRSVVTQHSAIVDINPARSETTPLLQQNSLSWSQWAWSGVNDYLAEPLLHYAVRPLSSAFYSALGYTVSPFLAYSLLGLDRLRLSFEHLYPKIYGNTALNLSFCTLGSGTALVGIFKAMQDFLSGKGLAPKTVAGLATGAGVGGLTVRAFLAYFSSTTLETDRGMTQRLKDYRAESRLSPHSLTWIFLVSVISAGASGFLANTAPEALVQGWKGTSADSADSENIGILIAGGVLAFFNAFISLSGQQVAGQRFFEDIVPRIRIDIEDKKTSKIIFVALYFLVCIAAMTVIYSVPMATALAKDQVWLYITTLGIFGISNLAVIPSFFNQVYDFISTFMDKQPRGSRVLHVIMCLLMMPFYVFSWWGNGYGSGSTLGLPLDSGEAFNHKFGTAIGIIGVACAVPETIAIIYESARLLAEKFIAQDNREEESIPSMGSDKREESSV